MHPMCQTTENVKLLIPHKLGPFNCMFVKLKLQSDAH